MVVGGNNNIFIFNKARGSLYYAKNMVMASNITFRKGFVIPVFRSFWDLLPCRNILSHTLINKKDILYLYLVQYVINNFRTYRIFVHGIFLSRDHLIITYFYFPKMKPIAKNSLIALHCDWLNAKKKGLLLTQVPVVPVTCRMPEHHVTHGF